MKKLILGLLFFCFIAQAADSANKQVQGEINKVLNSFHQAAGEADFNRYMSLLATDAVFLGTDSSERWTKSEFSAFVKPYFSQGKGWLYQPISRHVSQTPVRHIVFFDELLENKSYGRCRGTGVLINTPQGWKILQYNLSIAVPNGVANEVVESIKGFRLQLNND